MLDEVRELSDRPSSLPVALSNLVGRTREIAAVVEMVTHHRAVTIVGPGGAGKTRLALAVAEGLGGLQLGAPHWVELAAVSAGEGLVAPVVANALHIAQTQADGLVSTIISRLRAKRTVLVLDNCEQVVAECALLVEKLLRDCPALRVLATSREALGVAGERLFEVGGLEVPDRGEAPLSSDAVLLFCERVSALAWEWAPAEEELGTVAALCRRLDGLPLAIELAAGAASALGVGEVSSRLDSEANMLRHPSRSAPERHRTLEAALDWSYGLLTPSEKDLLRTLACFQGTFSLLAVEAVARGLVARGAGSTPVSAMMASLVGKSLVQVAQRGPEHRYRLLQTVRQQALAKLLASPEAPRALHAHSHFYAELAKQGEAGLEGRDQDRWLERLELEHDNMRAVLDRELLAPPGRQEAARPDVGGDLAGSLWAFWYRRGYYDEARQWLERAAQLSDQMSPAVRAKVLCGAGALAFLQCDYQVAESRLERARVLNEQLGDKAAVARAVQRLGSVQRERGNYEDARRLHRESLRLWCELGEPAGVASSEDYLGFVAWLECRYEEAEELCGRAFSYFERAGRHQECTSALVNLGAAALHAEEADKARGRLERALALARSVGYQEGTAWSLHLLGDIACKAGVPGGPSLLRESLGIHMGLGDLWRVASVLESLGAYWPEEGGGTSAKLVAAALSLREMIGAPVPPAERPLVDRAVESARRSLGNELFATCWEAGRAMSAPEAVALARQAGPTVAQAPEASPGNRPRAVVGALSEREVAVLRLVARGLSNKEIGRELFISQGTAGVHVSNILRKLGVTSRVQAAVAAQQFGL
jgi:predicted ATPase/DNA-binding CsgD family transcriptional regulator